MSNNSLEKNGVKIWGGLKETTEDERDAQFGSLFGLPSLSELPEKFVVTTLGVKDQKDSDFCTAFGTTLASEIQEETPLSPEFQYAMMKKVTGAPIGEWGGQIRDCLNSASKIGSLPENMVPANLRYNGNNREFVADHRNWPAELVAEAAKYAKGSFARVTGQYDLFDNIRATIWQANARYRKSGDESDIKIIVTGAVWRHAWTTAPDGIIPDGNFDGGFGHCFDVIGWTVKGGETYLVAQLSNGETIGRNGYYFFNRKVANFVLPYGQAFTLTDLDRDTLKHLVANKLPADSFTLLFSRVVVAITRFIQTFKK